MTEQPHHGQPNQQPYPYGQPPPQQGHPGPPRQQQPYQNPYPQQAPQQQPYPPQQYGAPQYYGAPQAPQPYPPQALYPQGPPHQQYAGAGQQYQGQQYPGQQYPGQQPYGQPPQGPNQPPGPDQAQAGPKPKKKRSRWGMFFLVLFSPFIGLALALYGLYWVLCWLLTPVALALHFVFCGLGLIWYSPVKLLASGTSRHRLFQPLYPKFPPLWTGAYWVLLNRRVRKTFEGLAAIAELLNW